MIQPPTIAPRMPITVSMNGPYPEPRISLPVAHPAIRPTIIHQSKVIVSLLKVNPQRSTIAAAAEALRLDDVYPCSPRLSLSTPASALVRNCSGRFLARDVLCVRCLVFANYNLLIHSGVCRLA